MAFLRDGTLDLITFGKCGLYSLNNEGDYIGSGGFGWTTQLPAKDYQGTARAKDLWALFESQDTKANWRLSCSTSLCCNIRSR